MTIKNRVDALTWITDKIEQERGGRMIARKVDINKLKQEKAELEAEIQTNKKEFESRRDAINTDMCESEELEMELSTMKHNVENAKQVVKDLIEFDKDDKKKLFEITEKLDDTEPKYTRPSERERPQNEAPLSIFKTTK